MLACKIPYLNHGNCVRTGEQILQILKNNYLIIYYVKGAIDNFIVILILILILIIEGIYQQPSVVTVGPL